jgi:tetratricopeptide (TPR) repeat protein
MLYTKALESAKKALSIDTQDGGANYYYGLVNAVLGNTVDAKDGFDLATLSTEYRSAAYTELSKIYLKEKSFEKALGYAERAVDYNRFNIEALQLQVVICRNMSNLTKAADVLKILLSYDALNHFSRFENYLMKPNEESKLNFTSLIRNELQSETYIELAIWYYNAGCLADAEKVFSLSPQTPEVVYWLSFLQNKKVNCAEINPAYSFPFRSETAFVLEQLLAKQSDWLLKYQLALIYKDRNRIEESVNLLVSCGDTPDFAPFYATRVQVQRHKNNPTVEVDLKKALSLDNQWRYQKLLAEFYNHQQHFDKALTITKAFYRTNPSHSSMTPLHLKNLIFNKMYKEAETLLANIDIVPTEGATEGRDLYREVKLMLAAQFLQKKKYSSALPLIKQARLYPENLGVGEPYEAEKDIRLEDWMEYLCLSHTNKTKEADALLNKIVQFKPRIENTIRNYISSNSLVTVWALDKLNRRDEAIQWLDIQIKDMPNDDILLWAKSVFANSTRLVIPEKNKDGNLRIIEALLTEEK